VRLMERQKPHQRPALRGQAARLAGLNEALAVVTVLRVPGHEAGHVIRWGFRSFRWLLSPRNGSCRPLTRSRTPWGAALQIVHHSVGQGCAFEGCGLAQPLGGTFCVNSVGHPKSSGACCVAESWLPRLDSQQLADDSMMGTPAVVRRHLRLSHGLSSLKRLQCFRHLGVF
jgi:hypothetical protein